MTIAIIDDEAINRLVLKKIILENCSDKKIIIEDGIISSSIQKINEQKPDIVLLDIELKNGTGFDIVKELNYKPQIIFTTAYEKYALQAIKIHAADYILKPIDPEELIEALIRCKNKVETDTAKNESTNANFYVYSTTVGKKSLNISDILYFESSGAYSYINTKNECIMISKNIGEIEKELPENIFYRTHHRYIVNIENIKTFESKRSGEITLLNNTKIPISQRRLKEFLSHSNFKKTN